MKNKNRTLKLVQTAILVAIVLIMAFTPLGYLKVGIFSIALVTIPVVIGAMTLGPGPGLILGTVFGLTSFVQCFGMDAFGTTLFNINPILTFIMCVPTRMLMGWLTGVIFRALYRIDSTKIICYFVGGLIGALLNTLFFMTVFTLGFFHTDYVQGLAGGKSLTAFFIAMIGVNGIVEMLTCSIVGGGVSKALSRLIKRTSDGEYI